MVTIFCTLVLGSPRCSISLIQLFLLLVPAYTEVLLNCVYLIVLQLEKSDLLLQPLLLLHKEMGLLHKQEEGLPYLPCKQQERVS